VRDGLDYWPPLPIIVKYADDRKIVLPTHEDNIVAALAHPNRVCRVEVAVGAWMFEKLSTLMQQPFPELTHLRLWCNDMQLTAPVFTDDFLGGSASRLRSLSLGGISFPALPSILPSATDLVSLRLLEINDADYISSEVMVTCLSTLPKLEHVTIQFYPFIVGSRRGGQGLFPERTRQLPLTRATLPSLTEFDFLGDGDYLDDFVARIDTPLLEGLHVTVFHDHIIEIPHLSEFILRTGGHTLLNEATLHADDYSIFITFSQSVATSGEGNRQRFQLGISFISYESKHWEIFDLALLCGEYLSPPLISGIERLYIGPILTSFTRVWLGKYYNKLWDWLNILSPFRSVESLYVSDLPHFALVMEEIAKKMVVGELTEEVLPALRMIQFETPSNHTEASIEEFVAMRQRSGHLLTVHHRTLTVP